MYNTFARKDYLQHFTNKTFAKICFLFRKIAGVAFTLNDSDCKTREELIESVNQLTFQSGGTDTDAAFDAVLNEFETYGKKNRQRLMILMTDGINANTGDEV